MRRSVSITGTVLCAMGLAVLIGWWTQFEMLVRVLPGAIAMTPNTAFCFLLTGIAIVASRLDGERARKLQVGCAIVVLLIAAITFSQHVFEYDAGTDRLLARIWLVDSNIHPGRMAPQTIAGFVAASILLLLLNSRFSMFKDSIIHVMLILLCAVGIVGVAGYVFNLSLLYSWYQHTAIAPHTALGFILVSFGLGRAWLLQRRPHQSMTSASVKPIGLAAFTMVVIIVLGSGLFGFVAMVTQNEALQRTHLENLLRLQTREIRSEIEMADALSAPIANRPFMNQNVNSHNQGTGGAEAIRAISQVANSFISNNITGLSIQGLNGELIAQAGEFQKAPEFNAQLDYQRRLLWKDAVFLRRSINLLLNGQSIGTAIVEIRLPGISEILKASAYIGKSAETVVCISLTPSMLQCIPSRLQPAVFKTKRSPNGRALPMEFALDRTAGAITTRDYRQQEVLATYNHISPYPLGIVTKVDTADLYAPIRKLFQLYLVLLIIFIVLTAAAHRFRKPANVALA